MKHPLNQQQGSILLMALMFMMVLVALGGLAWNTTGNVARNTNRSRNFFEAQAVADGALEYAYGLYLGVATTQSGVVTADSVNNALAANPPPASATYPWASSSAVTVQSIDSYGVQTDSTVAPPFQTGPVPGYSGWNGKTYSYVAICTVLSRPGDATSAVGVRRVFQYTSVPLFQSTFFFQGNLELFCPAQPMIVGGLMHTNGTAYMSASTGNLTIQGNVTDVAGFSTGNPPGLTGSFNNSPPTWSTSQAAQESTGAAIQAMSANLQNVFLTGSLNPNYNNGYHELIDPPSKLIDPITSATYDDTQMNNYRMYDTAGIRVDVHTTSGTSAVTIYAQNGTILSATGSSLIKSAFVKALSGATGSFTDERQNALIPLDVVNVDVGALTTQLTSTNISNFNNILYINDSTVSGTLSAVVVRLKNGRVLPSKGLTIGTSHPVYIQGDYNTGNGSVPSDSGNSDNLASPIAPGYSRAAASVVADAVTLLSNSWSDANSTLSVAVSRLASHTTYNTAILAGFNASTATTYSGGAINLPRFLEDWKDPGACMTYYGSMVQLFASESQTKAFQKPYDAINNPFGNVYSPPMRSWNYDSNLSSTPPPGSIGGIVMTRGAWARF